MFFYFCILILSCRVTRGTKDCEKEEFEGFYEKIEDILKIRDKDRKDLPLREFVNDQKNVYECGEILLRKMRECDAKNETALTGEERSFIRDEYSLLVSWIVACDSVQLWAGEKNGGSITSSIYHYVGGNPEDVIGPKGASDELTHIKYPQ